MVKEKISHSEEKKALNNERKLILFNDDFNTFDFVIESLIEVCNHQPEQAEQCAIITHFKGKCVIKTGSVKSMQKEHKELINIKLTV